MVLAGARLSPVDLTQAESLLQQSGQAGPGPVGIVPVTDDLTGPGPWTRFPPVLACLVQSPVDSAAVLLPDGSSSDPESVWKNVIAASQKGTLKVLPELRAQAEPVRLSLTPADSRCPAWKREAIDALPALLGVPKGKRIELTALFAGILQMGDHLDESHENSQRIEGQGTWQSGDYWHAIQHRREPDYGNARYWFRMVGSHPVLQELGPVVTALIKASGDLPPEVAGLVNAKGLDPVRFVEFVSRIVRQRHSAGLRLAQDIQWAEMLTLLEWTWQEAMVTR